MFSVGVVKYRYIYLRSFIKLFDLRPTKRTKCPAAQLPHKRPCGGKVGADICKIIFFSMPNKLSCCNRQQ